jgi:hypothetical protein
MKLRSLFLSLAAVIGAALVPPMATAATTIGVVPADPLQVSAGSVVAFSPTPIYTVPFPGVITYWSTSGGLPTDGSLTPQVSLKIFKTTDEPGTGNLIATVAASSRTFVLESEAETLPTRISVEKGEYLGLGFPAPGPHFAAGGESTACSAEGVGAPQTVYAEGQGLTCETGRGVAVSARLEPDDDGDGFGDESQDRCPGVAGPAIGCHARYRGRGEGRPFKLRLSTRLLVTPGGERAVPVIEENEYGIRIRCRDGYEVGFTLLGGVRKGAVVYFRRDGRFAYTRGLAPGDGILGGESTVAGRLEGTRGHGTVSGVARMRDHTRCRIAPYRWTVRG